MKRWKFVRLVARQFGVLLLLVSLYVAGRMGAYLYPRVVPWLALSTAILGTAVFLTLSRPVRNRYSERKLWLGFVAGLACIDLFSRIPRLDWLHWLFFPLLLSAIYSGVRGAHIASLYVLAVAMRCWGAERTESIGYELLLPLSLLGIWLGLGLIYRRVARKRELDLVDRLTLYEREADSVVTGSDRMSEDLRLEERGKIHLASILQEREESFRELLAILNRTLRPHSCAFYLYDAVAGVFTLKDFISHSDQFAERKVQPVDGIFSAVLKNDTSLRLVSDSGTVSGLTYYRADIPVTSVLAVPLKTKNIFRGLLLVDRISPPPFSDDELDIVEQVADQILRAMDNAEALHAYFHLKEELGAFFSASRALNQTLRLDEVVRILLHSAAEIVPFDWGTVLLYDPESEENRFAAESGKDRFGWSNRAFSCMADRSLVSWAIQNRVPLSYIHFRSRYANTSLFNEVLKLPNIYDSVLILPMQLKGRSLGAAVFVARADHAFSASARKMLEVVVLIASASLANARMVSDLKRLATTDGLTGLLNHRSFQERLSAEIDRASRQPAATSLLLIDIDFFKQFNDEFGHPAGDFVLRKIAEVLAHTVRKIDVVSRYGGEEFSAILPNTDAKGALQMAQRIVTRVRRAAFSYQGLSLGVTVSVGAATYPEHATNREALIARADRALYESKRRGRNRATLYDSALGSMSELQREDRLIEAAEDEIRRQPARTASA